MDQESDRWEYETLRPPRGETMKESEDPTVEINELAAERWRLVDTIDYTGGGTKYIVFERPVRSDANDGVDDAEPEDDTSGGDDTEDTEDTNAGGDTAAGDDADGTDVGEGGESP